MKKRTIATTLAAPMLLLFGTFGLQISGSPIDLSTVNFDAIGRFFYRVVPPDFSVIGEIWPLFFQTLTMAMWGTLIAGILGLTFSLLLGNRSIATNRAIKFIILAVSIITRSVPDLLAAFIFVSILGPGTAAGVLALALTSIGMFVRLLSTRIDEISIDKSNLFIATGMPRRSLLTSFVAQEVWPYFVSILGYRFDINLRSATTLGLAGAGGLGIALKLYFGGLDYKSAIAIILVIAVALLAIEFGSNSISRGLAGQSKNRKVSLRPGTRRTIKYFAFLITAIYMVWGLATSVAEIKIDWQLVGQFFAAMVAPDFVTHASQIWAGLLQSLSLATLGTVLGGLLALLVGIGGARTSGLPTWAFYVSRTFLVLKRSAPTVLFAIVFVIIFGMGTAAGVAALTIGVGGIGAKFIADSLEQVPATELMPLRALGITKFQFITSGLARISYPTLLKHLLYMFELNIRYATILGIIGAGGIGALVTSSIRAYDLGTTFAIIYLVSACVAVVELSSRRIGKIIA